MFPIESNDHILPSKTNVSMMMKLLVPSFKFMTHDRWANVLFLHWKLPKSLEPILQQNTSPFLLDRYSNPNSNNDKSDDTDKDTIMYPQTKEGSVYIGLILLTEKNVGPSIGRTSWTMVTHHGVNVRTYVRPVSNSSTATILPAGIHFSSLECDSKWTSFGANLVGMPYKVAKIHRVYGMDGRSIGKPESIIDADETSCKKSSIPKTYRLQSQRLPSEQPSIWRILTSAFGGILAGKLRQLHRTEVKPCSQQTEELRQSNDDSKVKKSFSVDCSWSHIDEQSSHYDSNVHEHHFTKWVAERYFVYTHKYGLNWSGQVQHEPWPLRKIQLNYIDISGVDVYEPQAMQPILRYMADNPPDSVLFSPGVGPVQFNMLRPL